MLVINGQKVEVPGVESGCFLDNPKLGFTKKQDFRLRKTSWVRSICVHTRMGIWPQTHEPSKKNRRWDELGVRRASKDDRIASWHISIDSDGSFVCHLDLAKHCAYHAGQTNDYSIGIECWQSADGNVTPETLASCVRIIDVITREFKIQRQFCTENTICKRLARSRKPSPKSRSQQLAYMEGGGNGEDFVGVFGHRNCTKNRGRGDPGDRVFDLLREAGYEEFVIRANEDLNTWKTRQERLGMLPPYDGIPGPGTVRVIEADNQAHGIWVPRPGDSSVEMVFDD